MAGRCGGATHLLLRVLRRSVVGPFLEGTLEHLVVLLRAQGHGAVDSAAAGLSSASRVRALDQRRCHLPTA